MKKFFFIILLFADLTYLYADTGSRQQLLLETIRCLDTNCIDEPTIQTLTHASEVFDIPELKSYAQLRQTNTIDTCSRRMLECVDRLIAYSDHLYDSVSYQSVYLRFLRMDFTMNIEKWEQQLAEVYRLTIALFQKDSNPENQELWYFAKLLQLIGNGIACNPTKEYDIVTLLLEIDDFYKDRPRSYIKQQIYSLAGGQMQTFAMNFKGYATCLGEILKQEEKNSAIFNMAIDTIYVYDTVPVYLTTNHFIKESFHCYSELHKNCFVDIFSEEIAYIWRSELWIDNPDVLISYMKDGYNQMTAYFGERDPACTVANLCIRQLAIKLNRGIDISAYDRGVLTAYFLPDGIIPYIKYLYFIVEIEVTNTMVLRNVCREMRQLAESQLSKYPARRIGACMGEIFLQRQQVIGHENAFVSLMINFEMECLKQASWELVDIGKSLAQYAGAIFGNIGDKLRIEYDVLRMIQQLASDTSLVFKAEYAKYLNYAVNAYPILPKDLDGEFGIEHLMQSVEKATANTMLYVPIKWTIASYYVNSGDLDKAGVLCKQLMEDITHVREQLKDKDYLRDIELEAYAQWLICRKDLSEKEQERHISRLEKLYFASPDCIRFLPIRLLNEYYSAHKQWDKAMRIVDFALEQLDELYGHNLWNGLYVQISQMKANVLINSKADIDQCRQMVERLNQEIQQIKEIGNYSVYLNLLQIMCKLTHISSPNDIIHYKNVRLLYEKAKEFYEASGNQDQVNFNYMLPAYTDMCQTVVNNWFGVHPNEYYLLCYDIEHVVLPNLLNMEERLQSIFPDNYAENSNYQLIICDIAMAYDIAYQPEMAEKYLEKLAPRTINKEKDVLYMFHYAINHNENKAMEHMQSFFQNDIDDDIYGSTGKAGILKGKWSDAVNRSDLKNAEQYAWEFYEAIQEYIQNNLPYFTQAETENFLMQNGVGGMPIQCMVAFPDIKQKKRLIEQAYNINLQQKGLMLRKADRLRQAVETSNDATLIATFDSLQQLRNELLAVDANQLMVNVDEEAIDKREKLFAMERLLARETKNIIEQEKEITWKDVQDNLRVGEAAVEYVVFPQLMYALVITPKCTTPQYVALDKGIEGLQFAYTILADTSLTDLQKTSILYNEESILYDALWKPLEKHFNEAKTIFFSPTGALNLICFHALRINASSFLTDRYDLHQLTNTALLAERNKHQNQMPKNRRAKVYGAIYYNMAQELNDVTLARMREQYTFVSEPLLASNRSVLDDAFPFLINTLYEADGIQHTLTMMGINSSEEIGYQPSEKAIRSLSGHSPEILHISTHGFFYNSPEEVKGIPYFKKGGELNAMTCSGLALANAEDTWLGLTDEDSKNDNILTSSEVSELDLRNTKLVVLSACQTGLGNADADGVFGLQRGFKQAGVESICASLWSVADKATSEMMQLFYRYWMSENLTMYDAMKRAMKEQRKNTPTPYYWASFVLLDAIE